ncbi:relaxase/mobilization nuclease domain-containing protein [Caulobacter sp. UC70_42]|uniref:relaxase/mobilization nuclease domain-containing protein n=1 Tax=Caulobacter sp. UC70_42 TaxID=3374551 RepID=UPI003757FA9A
MTRDDDFEPKLGRLGGKRAKAPRQIRSFSSEVSAATRRSGLGTLDLGPKSRVRSFGRGRSVPPSHSSRRVVIKARIVRHQGARFRAASVGTHLYYLRRGGSGRDGRASEAFDRDGAADHGAFAARSEPDRHHFRFIVSPEDAEQLSDLGATTRDLMAQMERDLGTRLDWVAVDHWNTDNPHVHILVRGVAEDGSDLVIDRDYIARGLRERAQLLVTQELGPRSALEIGAAADREVSAERWTGLDRRIVSSLGETGEVDLRPRRYEGDDDRRRLVGRLQVLQRYGFADERAPGRWQVVEDLEPRLRELALRGDIIKSLHRAMGEGERDPASLIIEGDCLASPVTGRVVERGLHDELNGQAYVIVDGVDGRLHHFRFATLHATGDTPAGGLLEIRAFDSQGAPGLQVIHRSDLSIDRQISADGATWLDRQLVVKEPTSLASHGFGAEVRSALDRRRDHLVSEGRGRIVDGQFKANGNLIGSLRQGELDRVEAQFRKTSGGVVRAGEGEPLTGVYARRLDLASGRFAMIDDGLGFQLVPWTKALDAKLGQEVTGTITKAGVEWSLGKKRGLGL